VLEDVLALLLYPSAPEGRMSCQGIATSFSDPEVVEMDPLVDPGVDCEEAEELEVVPLVLELLPLDEPEYEITAKSIRPEAGLMITSSILPRSSPVEVFTLELVSLLARISCWPIRPVAPKRELEP